MMFLIIVPKKPESTDDEEKIGNEESDLEEESDEWYRDWYLSYLSDIAKDNVEGIVEDLGDELELASKIKEVEIDVNNADYMKFVAILCSEDFEEDLEETLNDYL